MAIMGKGIGRSGGARMGGSTAKSFGRRGSGLSKTWGAKQSRTTSTGARVGQKPTLRGFGSNS